MSSAINMGRALMPADRFVVEVFAGCGRAVITDRVVPRPGSDGLSIYSRGREARIVSLIAWKLCSAWEQPAASQALSRRKPVRTSLQSVSPTISALPDPPIPVD